MLHLMTGRTPANADHVKSGLPRALIFPVQKMLRSTAQALLFWRGHIDRRMIMAGIAPGFDLHKHQKILMDGDQVDFSIGAAVIALYYAVPF